MAKFEGDYGPPAIDIKRKAQAMTIEEIESALVTAKVIKNAIRAIEDEATRRIQQEPDKFQMHEWKSGPPRAQVSDLAVAVHAMAEYDITADEMIDCFRSDALTAGKTSKLEKLLYKKLNAQPDNKVTHPEAFEILTDALTNAGVLRLKSPDPRLVFNPEKALKGGKNEQLESKQ